MPLSPPTPPAIALGIISERRHFCKVQWIPFLSEATNQVPLFREWQWGVNPTRLSFLKTCRPTPSCLLLAWGPNAPRLKLWVRLWTDRSLLMGRVSLEPSPALISKIMKSVKGFLPGLSCVSPACFGGPGVASAALAWFSQLSDMLWSGVCKMLMERGKSQERFWAF